MFESPRYQFALWKLQRIRRGIVRDYAFRTAKAREAKDQGLIAELENNRKIDLEECDEDISQLATNYLRQHAQRYLIQIRQDDWYESEAFGTMHLKPDAIARVRSEIRNEEKAYWDYWASRLTMVIAVVGCVFGILAYFKK